MNANHQPSPPKSGFSVLKGVVCGGVGVIVLAIVGVLVLTTISRHRKVKWIEYRPGGLDFTVMMPSKPARLEPIVTPLVTGNMSNYRYVSAVTGQGTAVIGFVDYTGTELDMDAAAEALHAELDSLIERTNATLISKKSITYQGMPGLEFEVSSTGQHEAQD